MSFSPFPDTLYVRKIETNENAAMGDYTLLFDTEMTQIILRISKQGVATGSESFKIQIFGDTNTDTALYESNSVTIDDIDDDVSFDAVTSGFLADVPFDFSNVCLNAGVKYYMTLKLSSYTRNADVFYIGYVMDNAEPILVSSAGSGARAGIIGLV